MKKINPKLIICANLCKSVDYKKPPLWGGWRGVLLMLCCFACLSGFAQTVDNSKPLITGKVTDADGNAMSAVMVSILDDFKVTSTNNEGEFVIEAPVSSVLYFKTPGFIPQKKEVTERGMHMRITLMPENEEPVYQVGYGTRTRSELTTAISVIGANDISTPLTVSAETALTGKAAGLTVLRDNGDEPGMQVTNFYIRGIGTENGMRSPYILVDDVERNFKNLDVHEIESVTILKDGAANAQYGQRGANGTILVTTKRGFVGKPEVEFISQLGTQQPTRLPEFSGSKEYVTFYNKALQNDGIASSGGDKFNPDTYTGSQDPLLYPDVNWYDEMIRKNSLQQQYKLMLRGGTDVIRYFMLLGYQNQDGLFKHGNLNDGYKTNLNYNKYNVRANLDANVTKSLLVSLDIAGQIANRNMPNASSEDVSVSDEIFTTLSSLVPNAMPVQYADTLLAGTSLYRKNPLGMISRTGYRQDRAVGLQIKAKAVLDLELITDGLNAEAAFGYDGNSSYGLYKSESYATYEQQANGSYTRYGENVPLSLDMQETNKAYSYLMSFWAGLNYNRTFNHKHAVGGNVRYYQARTFVRQDNPPYGKQGINGNAGYGFDKRYFIDFSFAWDGSDEFAPGNRFGFFPGVSVGWLISNEQFLKHNNTLTFLKLRASYGEAGNCKTSGLDRYAYQSNWAGYESSSNGYIFGSGFAWSDAAREGRLENPGLTWETTRNVNLGVDLSLLNKISVSADGFVHKRDNIILEMTESVSSVTGAPAPYANAGSVTNKGFETSVTYTDHFNKLNYFVQGNVSFARNEITKTDENANQYDNLKRTGHSVSQQWGMLATGYYKDQADIDGSPVNTLYKVKPGDIKYADVNKDGIINALDEIAIGDPLIPEWTLGLSAGIEYAGVDFSFLLSAYMGRSVILDNSAVWLLRNNGNATSMLNGAWEAGVREDDATYPRLTTEDNKNNYRNSTYWLKNGNFLRLNNVEIGYSFPDKWISKIKMKQLRVYVNAQNLLTIDHLSDYNLDPEAKNAGVTGYPMTRQMNVGLSVKF